MLDREDTDKTIYLDTLIFKFGLAKKVLVKIDIEGKTNKLMNLYIYDLYCMNIS